MASTHVVQVAVLDSRGVSGINTVVPVALVTVLTVEV